MTQIFTKYDVILCFLFDIIDTKIDDNIRWRMCNDLPHVIFKYKITPKKNPCHAPDVII